MLELDSYAKDILVIVIFHPAVADCIMGGDMKTDAKAGITTIISDRIRDLNKPLSLSINLRHITRPILFLLKPWMIPQLMQLVD